MYYAKSTLARLACKLLTYLKDKAEARGKPDLNILFICIWVAVAGLFVPNWIYNIGTTVLNGGVSMVVFFVVNKIVFNDSNGGSK